MKAVEDIVMQNAFLQNKQKRSILKPTLIPYEKENWLQTEIEKYPTFLLIQKFKDKMLIEHMYLCWNDTEGCCYDCISSTMVKMGARDMRIKLMKLFEIKEAQNYE